MHVHVPKPLHGWPAFLNEIMIVVIGILIALGMDQSIEATRDHGLAREAKAAIKEEMRVDVSRIAYRLGQQACIDKRLDEIQGLLAKWADGQEFAPPIWIGDPGDVGLIDQRWQASLNSGRFSRESSVEQSQQADFYTALHIVNDTGHDEYYTWGQLRALEMGSHVLTPASRPMLIQALQSARSEAKVISLVGAQILERGRKLGILPDEKSNDLAILGSTCQPLTTMPVDAGPVRPSFRPGRQGPEQSHE